jgi:hypothetical protein
VLLSYTLLAAFLQFDDCRARREDHFSPEGLPDAFGGYRPDGPDSKRLRARRVDYRTLPIDHPEA